MEGGWTWRPRVAPAGASGPREQRATRPGGRGLRPGSHWNWRPAAANQPHDWKRFNGRAKFPELIHRTVRTVPRSNPERTSCEAGKKPRVQFDGFADAITWVNGEKWRTASVSWLVRVMRPHQ